MAYSERLPIRLNPLAERTCFSQVASSLAHFDYRAFIAEYRLGETRGSNVMLVEDAGA